MAWRNSGTTLTTIGRSVRIMAVVSGVATLMCGPAQVAAQSLLDQPPNLGGTWTGSSGTLYFHFMHRFASSDPPVRKVTNTPTFFLAAALPAHLMVGARYATSSALVTGFANEWEFFGRFNPVSQMRGAPLDLSVHGGFNHAAESFDGELAVARTFGRLRLLGAARGFSNFARADEARWAVAGGATVRVHRFVALAADVATLLDRDDQEEDVAWSAGLQLAIPYTPHSFSLHYSNVATTTLEGASIGLPDGRWGFEFTVPFTISRYLGGRSAPVAAETDPAPVAGAAGTVEVTMSNRLTFEPRVLRIKVGQTVVWRNTSDVVHTVTADPELAANTANVSIPRGARTFNSGDMAPGAAFRHAFTVVGEYKYICIPHELAGGMLGVVIVES
ncbi:MAG: cupredoxin domain-containing protein [Longimicrobiales bacterium]